MGIEDQTKDDGIRISDRNLTNFDIFSDGRVVEFVNPGEGLFTSISNPFGTVQTDDSVRIDYSISTDKLFVANYAEKLVVLTNDPVNNPGLFTANFEITSGSVPKFMTSSNELDYGKVFQKDQKSESFFVADTGKAPLTLLSATFKHGYYSIDGSFPQVLKPKRSIFYGVEMNTSSLGIFNDTLVISTDEGKTYEVAFKGEVIDAPEISSSLSDISETLASGETKSLSLTITNNGNNDLDFAPVGNQWLTIAEKATKQVPSIPSNTYFFKSSKDEGGPEYQWNEIASTENKVLVGDLWMGENPWSQKIDLPFTFNFYGNNYNYLYVGYNGLISFTPDQEINPFGGDQFPNISSPNNFIAALYGFIGPSGTTEYPNTGWYCKAENDKATIEFCDFNTGFVMTGPMSFQIIIYKDGNIKLQYKLHELGDADAITHFGQIGIENVDGTDGVLIAYYSSGYRHETAYELFPSKKYVIAKGASKDFDVTLNAKELFAGTYSGELKLINNAPLGQGLAVPVSLTVTGAPEITAPVSVDLGDILVVETQGTWSSSFKSYEKEFEIENTGTAKAEISQFDISMMSSSTVYAYVLGEDWFGNPIYQWTDVAYLPAFDWNTWEPIPMYLQPKASMKYKVEVTPTSAGEVKDTLTVVTDNGNIIIPINANSFMPPVISVSSDTVKVYAQIPTLFETKSLQIDNEGGYDLNYSLAIDYKRSEETTTSNSQVEVNTSSSNPTIGNEKIGLSHKVKSTKDQSFNRELAFENATAAETSIGYGGTSSFYAATTFQAPSDGFNLTHVQTWYNPGSWLNSKIKVQVYAGSNNLNKATLIHSQTYEYNITTADPTGEMLTIQLDKNLLFYPNEYFFVVCGYESGATYPQGAVSIPQVITNRYMYGTGNGVWYDLTDVTSLASYGWMVRACESNYQSAVWVSLASSPTGTIAEGQSGSISLDFKANYANPGSNIAKLEISSNDPNQAKKYVTLLLQLNQGPKFDIDKTALTVEENQVLNFKVAAKDIEGDNFTMAMTSSNSFVSSTIENDTMSITCAPTYDDAGIYTITVEAIDALNNKSEASILLTVKNVNRAPVVINPVGNRGITSSEMPNISLSSVIADPDGETLSYNVVSSNESIVKVYLADDAMILTTKSAGTTTITITGTDPEGLSVSHSFNLTVFQTGIDDNKQDEVKVYPNPTSGNLYIIHSNGVDKNTTIKITNIIGSTLYEGEVDGSSNQTMLNISNYPNGVYFVRVKGTNTDKTIKVVKN